MLPSEPQAIQEEGDSQENDSPTRSQSTQIYNDLGECTLSSNATDLVLTHGGDPLIITSQHDLHHDTSAVEQKHRPTLAWPMDTTSIAVTRQDGTAVPLTSEGGVIVLGKVQQDGTVSALLPRDYCQDIVLMVELKYNKDMLLPELQGQHVLPQIERDGSLKQVIKARIMNYVSDSDVAARQVIKGPLVDSQGTFTEDSSLPSKTNLLTYDVQGNPQNTCIAYSSNQPITLAKETLSYIPDGQTLANTHTITFEDSSHLGTLTKEQALSLMAGTSVLPNAQIISFAPDPDPGTDVGQITRTHLVSYTSDPPATEFVDTGVVDPQLAHLVYESENIPSEVPEMKVGDADGPKPANEKPYPCTICHKRFMRRTNLRSHMAHHTSERPHRCETCGKSFALRWDLTLHLRLHTGVLSCEVCGKAFSVPGKLERHKRIHSGERPFSCTQCGKAFSDKHNLEAHIRTHSDERPFSCQTCGNTFRSKSHLRAHRRVHTQDTPFACHLCGKAFKWKANLNLHLKGHAGERAKCDGCGREFARAADLARHRRSHEGLRPHTCTMCTRTYIDRGALNKHMKSHTEDRPYVCDICHKGFHYQWYLTAHKKVHDSDGQEKKFRCDYCDKEYCKKSTLTAHLKTHARLGTVIENTQLVDSSENAITILSTMSLSTGDAVEPGSLAVAGDHTMSSNHTVSSDHSVSVDNPESSDRAVSTDLAVSSDHAVLVISSDHAISADLQGSADHAVSSDHSVLADHVSCDNAVSSDHALSSDHVVATVSSDHSNLIDPSSLDDTKTTVFLTERNGIDQVDKPQELVVKTVMKTESVIKVDHDSSSMDMTAA